MVISGNRGEGGVSMPHFYKALFQLGTPFNNDFLGRYWILLEIRLIFGNLLELTGLIRIAARPLFCVGVALGKPPEQTFWVLYSERVLG